jgi:hypothetical protein
MSELNGAEGWQNSDSLPIGEKEKIGGTRGYPLPATKIINHRNAVSCYLS